MPGIAGIVSDAGPGECRRLLEIMVRSMVHEPGFVTETCVAGDLGMYGGSVMRAPSACSAPEVVERKDDRIFVAMAGEALLPSGLERCADHPRRVQDLVALMYEQEGDSFVSRLNGAFSGLLIDRIKKRLVLINDRYGLERVYWTENEKGLFFASEAKALLRVCPEARGFDDEGVAQFLSYGCTWDTRTLFKNVQLLSGGSIWSIDFSRRLARRSYFSPALWEKQRALTEEGFECALVETFASVLPRYLISRGRIGISLTGGLDTRLVLAGIAKHQVDAICYTFSGLTEETRDARLAARVALACGLPHEVLRIDESFLSRFEHFADKTVFVTDGCAGVLDAHEIYLNRLARELSPIRLTGNFGSEVFRNMSTYKRATLAPGLLSGDLRAAVQSSSGGHLQRKIHAVRFAAFEEVPRKLFGIPAAAKSQLIVRTPYLDNDLVQLAFRAPMESRDSPKAFLRLVQRLHSPLAAIPTDRGVRLGERGLWGLARRALAQTTFKLDYIHMEGLPMPLAPLDPMVSRLSALGLLGQHKYLPYRYWLKRELSDYLANRVMDARTRRLRFWNPRFLERMPLEHSLGRKNLVREINAVLTLEAVDRLLIRG